MRAAPSWRLDDITKPLCTHLSRYLTYLWNTDNVVIVKFLSFRIQALRVIDRTSFHTSVCSISIYIYIAGLSLILLHEYLYLRKKKKGNLPEDRSYLYLSVWKNWSNEPCHDTLRNVSMENEIRWNYIIYLWMKNCHLNLFYS